VRSAQEKYSKRFVHFFCILQFFLSLNNTVSAQDPELDSLKIVLSRSKEDSSKCRALMMITNIVEGNELEEYTDQMKGLAEKNIQLYHENVQLTKKFKYFLAFAYGNYTLLLKNQSNLDLLIHYHLNALKLREEIGDRKGMAETFNGMGVAYFNNSKIQKATEYYQKAADILTELGNKTGLAYTYNNIGLVQKMQGQIEKAIASYGKSLSLFEELKTNKGIGMVSNNLGGIYKEQGELEKADQLYRKGFYAYKKVEDIRGMSFSYNNIGLAYREGKKIDSALYYLQLALNLRRSIKDLPSIAASLKNIALIQVAAGKNDEALVSLQEALGLLERSSNKNILAGTLIVLTDLYIEMGKLSLAAENAKKSLSLGKELGFPEPVKLSAHQLYRIGKKKGDEKSALQFYELYIQMRDSINNESTRKASIRSQLKYEYEKQAVADSVSHAKESEIKNVELKRQSAEIKAKKNQQYALFGGLGLVIIFAGFMFNRFKITQKQKRIIEHQKEIVEEQKKLVEEKQKEILDSIRYAKRIQMAQIPSEKRVFSVLKRMQGPEVK
jgi:tetratricopeptide (TPR) repeat protein